MSAPRGDCIRCGGENKAIKARRLCESCYMQVKKAGTLEKYPTLNRRRRHHAGYCHCFRPIPERFGLYDITQCKKCGRKIG